MTHIKSSPVRRRSVVAGLISLAGLGAPLPCQLVAQEIQTIAKPVLPASIAAARPETSGNSLPVASTVEGVLKRLKELGAVAKPSSFVVVNPWNGTDADLNLLHELPGLRTIDVNLTMVSPEALSALKLNRLDRLCLRDVSVELLAKITRLPECDQMAFQFSPPANRKRPDPFNVVDEPCESPSPEMYRRLAQLAAGVKLLQLESDPFGKIKGIDNDGLKFIGQIGSLEELEIVSAGITDAGLAHLAGHKKLARLTFGACPGICGPGLTNLAWIDTLRYLFIYNAPLNAEGVWALASLTHLQELSLMPSDFPSAEIQPADVHMFKRLTQLQTLKIESWMDHTGRRMLTPAAAEKHLALGNAILSAVSNLPALKKIEMHGVGNSADGIEALAKLPQLEQMSLRPVMLDDRGLAAIGQWLELRNFRLAGKESAAANLRKLPKSPQLAELTLGNGQVAADLRAPTAAFSWPAR